LKCEDIDFIFIFIKELANVLRSGVDDDGRYRIRNHDFHRQLRASVSFLRKHLDADHHDLINKKGVNPMQTITPHLWFDKEAKEAAAFYTSIFKDSEIKNTATLHNTPSGTVNLLTIELSGREFRLINAGPILQVHSGCIVSGCLRHGRGSRCIVE
jgi:hypothetical protein